MLGTRTQFEGKKEELSDTELRIQVESLRYLRENDPEAFEDVKTRLKGTGLWKRFEREYGD